MLVLDDLHWSDGASIELISALIGREPDAPVLLALGFRPGQADERLCGGRRDTAGEQARSCSSSAEQEAALLLDQVDAESVAAIYRHGGGNPFYLEQLGRASGEDLAAALDGQGVEGGLPAAVKGAIAGELESLSAPSRAFLDAAAVAGEPFEPDLAAVIAELSQADGLDALDDLLELDLIRPTEVPRRFIFRHPLVRRAVYESTRGGWRLGAHGRAADALAARGAAPAERAHHIEQSAGPGDQDAIELLLEAGRAAASRAPATAARWFEAALRLLPDADTERQVEVRVALASALRSVGELDRCRASLLEATDLLDPEAVARRVELTALCAAVEHWQGHHDDAHRRLTRAWEELADHDTPEAAALQIELGLDGMYRLDFEQAIEVGRAALDASRAVGDGGLIAAAAAALALAEAASGKDVESARAHLAEALEQIERLSDTELARRLETLYYLGWAENYLELYDDAIAHAERGVEIARATGEGRLLIPLMLVRGYPYEMQGRLSRVHRDVRDRRRERAPVRQPALPLVGAVRARLGALLLRRPRSGDRGVRGERARRGRPPEGRDDAVRRRRAGLGARGRLAGDRRDRARLRADAEPGARSRSRPGGAVLQLGEHRARAPHAGQAGGGRGLRAPGGGAVRRARPAAARGDRAAHARRGAAGRRRRARGRSGGSDAPRPRLDAIGAALQAAFSRSASGPGARRRRRAAGGDRGAARGGARVRRVRLGADARRGAARAAQARRARGGARQGRGGGVRASARSRSASSRSRS